MTDYTTPDQAEEGSREFAGGYHEGRLWAEEQAAIQARGRELKIADLTAEAAKWQRLYLEACEELAVNRALLEDATEALDEWPDIVRSICDLAATVPQGD